MKLLLAVLGVAGSLFAQSSYPKRNITVGLGAALPGADLERPFRGRPGGSFAYGYRFQRYFQADFGVDFVVGAGGVRAYMETPIGPLRIRDYQFFIPVGGRALLPLAGGRVLISGGGGGSYLHYTELLRQPTEDTTNYFPDRHIPQTYIELLRQPTKDIRYSCPVCGARSGRGYYGLVGVDLFLDKYRHFRFGGTSKLYRGYTDGAQIGAVPGIRTQDRWLQIFAHFGFSF